MRSILKTAVDLPENAKWHQYCVRCENARAYYPTPAMAIVKNGKQIRNTCSTLCHQHLCGKQVFHSEENSLNLVYIEINFCTFFTLFSLLLLLLLGEFLHNFCVYIFTLTRNSSKLLHICDKIEVAEFNASSSSFSFVCT